MKFALLHNLAFLLIIITGVALLSCSACEQSQNEITLAIDSDDEARIPNAVLGETETKDIYVADEQMAINIAAMAWIPFYGKEQIESERALYSIAKKGNMDRPWFAAGRLGWRRCICKNQAEGWKDLENNSRAIILKSLHQIERIKKAMPLGTAFSLS